MGNMRRRWDTDERGTGIGSGEPFLPNIAKLGDAMRDPGWVTEDPELHLLPHLEKACSEPGSPLRLVSARSAGLVFVVELEWTGERAGAGAVRAAAVALLGRVAEEATHIHQRRGEGFTDFEVVTGSVPSETAFEPHGHLIRLRVKHAVG